jgi:hypothetical protein
MRTPQIDVATARLPRRGRRQQGGGPGTEYVAAGAQLERRLLAGTAHELTTAETIDRLGQTAFELVTLDLPGNVLQRVWKVSAPPAGWRTG